jgi:hypothetical protein
VFKALKFKLNTREFKMIEFDDGSDEDSTDFPKKPRMAFDDPLARAQYEMKHEKHFVTLRMRGSIDQSDEPVRTNQLKTLVALAMRNAILHDQPMRRSRFNLRANHFDLRGGVPIISIPRFSTPRDLRGGSDSIMVYDNVTSPEGGGALVQNGGTIYCVRVMDYGFEVVDRKEIGYDHPIAVPGFHEKDFFMGSGEFVKELKYACRHSGGFFQ